MKDCGHKGYKHSCLLCRYKCLDISRNSMGMKYSGARKYIEKLEEKLDRIQKIVMHALWTDGAHHKQHDFSRILEIIEDKEWDDIKWTDEEYGVPDRGTPA